MPSLHYIHTGIHFVTSYDVTDKIHQQTTVTLGLVEVGVKRIFKPGVTHGITLHQHSLELLMGQLYTSTALMYSRDNFTPLAVGVKSSVIQYFLVYYMGELYTTWLMNPYWRVLLL